MLRIRIVLLAALAATFLYGAPVASEEGEPLVPSRGKIDPQYFGVHIHRALINSLWKTAGFGTWRLLDANVGWVDLEPAAGHWQFDRLDSLVTQGMQAHLELVLPLGFPPSWAASRPDEKAAYGYGSASLPRSSDLWQIYVSTVVKRYKGRIRDYEVWNEPNLSHFFSGTPEEMAALTRETSAIIKKLDPEARVVSASVTGDYGIEWFTRYLRAGGGDTVDVVGYHFYTKHRDPEAMLPIVINVRRALNNAGFAAKPLWNTETGWLMDSRVAKIQPEEVGFDRSARVLSNDESVAYVLRALLLGKAAGLERYYWYAWDNAAMGLTEGRGIRMKPAAKVMMTAIRLLSDAILQQCGRKLKAVWVCEVRRSGNERLLFAWTQQGVEEWAPPAGGIVRSFDQEGDLDVGRQVSSKDLIKVTIVPVVFFASEP